MTQTQKAQQNQAGQQKGQDSENQDNQQMAELAKVLAPLVETVAQLKADKAQESADKVAAQEAAHQEELNKAADISGMLDNANLSEEGRDRYENLSKRQIVEVIAGAVETAMEANATKIKGDIAQTLAPGEEKIALIEKTLYAVLGKMGVEESRGKHADFDEYGAAISKIMGETPGITYERAYLVAKGEKAGDLPPKNQIDTEKPSDTPWSPQPAQGGALPNQNSLQVIADRGRDARAENAVTKSGTVGIRNIINAGIDKMQAAKE